MHPRVLPEWNPAGLELYEGMYYDPKTGEAIILNLNVRPKGRFIRTDEEGENRTVAIATGWTFEAVTQAQATTQKVTPWGHATEETARRIEALLDASLPQGCFVVATDRRPQDDLNLMKYTPDPLEFEVLWDNGSTLRQSVGLIASMLARAMSVDPANDDAIVAPTAPTMLVIVEELARKAANPSGT